MNATVEVKLRRPADFGTDNGWAFVLLPKSESDKFSRRGRTSAQGTINGLAFQGTLEPDGQLSHWLKIPASLMKDAGVVAGECVVLEVQPCAEELEPELPPAFRQLLDGSSEARQTWEGTTTIARIDWIHWIESAKQPKTRMSRLKDAREMLASGKKRVCCFDPSGYYSKSLSAPREAE